ncbi:carboxylesterase family protein [Rhizobium sp. TRM95111]|uniref:carboxylesterase/lipase family protein n=1 Tax=Rhizobium alarense TaxID=2846851 RepID=UPI001F2EAE5A|nr:carboxylesterase family protein [Rhizobium alarense]MCF3642011.1 carboxylesterase family protein [Rhizobium alarense]
MHQPDYSTSASPADPIIEVEQGRLRGRTDGRVYRFLGVPYAAPPIGAARWLPPRPPARWEGLRDAGEFAPVAPQPRDAGNYPGDPSRMPERPMDEDCLYLNLWVPRGEGPFPVLVWLHGGSQVIGGTSRPVYDGSAFAQNGILCVTVGHRLGMLGLLFAEAVLGADYADSANAMLRDQIAALAWVRANIARFGGNPARVTLGGESAGAKNVAVLMATPAAHGLFHAAISLCGGADTVLSETQARSVAQDLVERASLSADELLSAAWPRLLASQEAMFRQPPFRFPFRPIFGGALLPERPLAMIESGQADPVPMLLGTCRDECYPVLADRGARDDWTNDMLAHLPGELMERIETEAAMLHPELDQRQRRLLLLTAEEYELPSIRLAKRLAARGSPTWVYRNDQPQLDGPFKGYGPHVSDLDWAWGHRDALAALPADAAVRYLHRILCDFVRHHTAPWQPYTEESRVALLSRGVSVGLHPNRDLHDLFDEWS